MKQEPMPKSVVEDFRRILGLQVSDPIPPEVKAKYLSYRYMKDVSSAGPISASELILLAMMAGHGARCPGIFNAGDKVHTVFDGKESTGVFLQALGGKDEGKAQVNIDNDQMKYREVLLSDTKIKR